MDTIIMSGFGCWTPVRATDDTIGGPHWWHQSRSSRDGQKGEHQLHEVCGSNSPVQCRHCGCKWRCNWMVVKHEPWWWYGPYIPSSQLGGDSVGGAFCPVEASPLSCGEWLWVLSTGKGRWQHYRGTMLVASTTHQWVVMVRRERMSALSSMWRQQPRVVQALWEWIEVRLDGSKVWTMMVTWHVHPEKSARGRRL